MTADQLKRHVSWALAAAFLICLMGWFVVLQEGESVRLAALSSKLWKSGQFPDVSDQIYEDQPPLILWLSAISIGVFGENQIAFRLPGFLFLIAALFSVKGFCKIYYPRETQLLAVLILGTMGTTFLLSRDVRSETYVMSFYVFVIWQSALYQQHRRLQNLVPAIFGILLIILSKRSFNDTASFDLPRLLATFVVLSFPWTLFVILGLWKHLKSMFDKNRAVRQERISVYAVIMPFILICLNPFQSPYDAIILSPPAAVIAADYLTDIVRNERAVGVRRIYYIHILMSFLVLGVLFCLIWFPFRDNNYFGLIHFMALLAIFCWLVFFSGMTCKLILSCSVLAIGCNLVLNSYFYPNMLRYQAGTSLGMVARRHNLTEGHFFSYQIENPFSLRFYSGRWVEETADFKKLVNTKNCLVFTDERFLSEFRAARPGLTVLGTSEDFDVSFPTLAFLDPDSRRSVVSRKVLLRL